MKKIILIFFLFLLTGCSATYDLYIGEKLTDDIFVYEDNDILKKLDYYDMNNEQDINVNYYNYQLGLFENKFENDRIEYSTDDVSGYRYNYTYNYNKMGDKSMIYDCYDMINIVDENKLIVETSNSFKCFDKYSLLDEVTVNIYYGGRLISTNADSYDVDKGVYTWIINKNNYNIILNAI